MSSPPKAWSTVLVDIGEWTMMARKQKLKFMMVIDGATKFKATHLIMTYSLNEQGNENAQQVIEGFSHCWLADKPRPMIVIPDNASTLRSTAFREFCDNNNIWLLFPVEKEPWAHGIAERGIQELKLVMDKIYIEDATLSAATSLSLATSSLNAVENVHGFSPFQWAYGQSFHWTDEDVVTHAQLRDADEFGRLLAMRKQAEDLARKVHAEHVLSKLKNSSARQPCRTFSPTTLVNVWKKMLHLMKLTKERSAATPSQPRLIGLDLAVPGTVIFQEQLPEQQDQDRKHVVWVVLGGRVHRCSIHSVRPLTDQEQVIHDLAKGT